MDLRAKIDEVKLTSIEIQSYESERALVNGTVLADIDPLHEAHVGVVKERLGAAVWIRRGTRAPHVRDPDKTVKIGDASGLQTGAEEIEVKQLATDVGPARDRIGRGVVHLRQGRAGTQYGGAQNSAKNCRRAADKPPPRDGCVMWKPVAQ